MADDDRRKIAVAQTTSFCRCAAAMTFLVVLRGTVPQLKVVDAVGVMRDLYRVIIVSSNNDQAVLFIPLFRRVPRTRADAESARRPRPSYCACVFTRAIYIASAQNKAAHKVTFGCAINLVTAKYFEKHRCKVTCSLVSHTSLGWFDCSSRDKR